MQHGNRFDIPAVDGHFKFLLLTKIKLKIFAEFFFKKIHKVSNNKLIFSRPIGDMTFIF
jgi:hypothetical protein